MKALVPILVLLLFAYSVYAQNESQPALKGDLEVISVFTNPERPMEGSKVDVYFVVKNIGSELFKGEMVAELMVGPQSAKKTPITDAIGPNNERRYKFDSITANSGSFNIVVKIAYEKSGKRYVAMSTPKEMVVEERADLPEERKTNPILGMVYLVVIGVIVIIAIGFIAAYVNKRRKKEAPVVAAPKAEKPDEGKVLADLYKEKEELEERVKLAKVKFFKRKIDEDSYKEIVTKNQGKLIEVEAKIEKLGKRVTKLEEAGK